MDFLIFSQFFFLYRVEKGNTKCPIAIADLLLLCIKCMEGQYGKDNVLSLDLYKSYPQLKGQFAKYCRVFEIRLRSLVSTYRVLQMNEKQSTKLDVACFITEWRASAENTLKPLTLEDFKTLLLLEIQLLLGCDIEWSVPCRRLVLTLTIPFSPLPETTQKPMNPPRKAAQAALLPRLHRCGL